MPDRVTTLLPAGAPQLPRQDGQPLQLSLFSPVYQAEFSTEPERNVAVWLDGDDALRWWHRNVSRTGYGVQGWRKHSVYPDFIVSRARNGGDRIIAIEMKGDHLAGNADTEYKRALFNLLSDAFSREDGTSAGTLQLVQGDGVTVECRMVLFNDWQSELPQLLKAS